MRKITFSLPKKEVKEGDPQQEGLYFNSYMMRKVHLMPGETVTIPIRDEGVGYYSNWTDQDIVNYYTERYGKYGLVVSVSGNSSF